MGDQEVMHGAPKTLAQDLGIDVPQSLFLSLLSLFKVLRLISTLIKAIKAYPYAY